MAIRNLVEIDERIGRPQQPIGATLARKLTATTLQEGADIDVLSAAKSDVRRPISGCNQETSTGEISVRKHVYQHM